MKRIHLPIANPCHEDWDSMDIEGARRFCEVCDKHVHNLSEMTEPEARDLLAAPASKGRLCVRYRSGSDGEIRFKEPTTAAPTPRAASWMMAAAGLAAALLTGCADTSREPDAVYADRCEYSLGPWTFSAARGEGSCPPAEVHTDIEVMGAIPVADPQIPSQNPPPEIMGEVAIEPPPPEPVPEVMGKIAPPEPEVVEMGDIAAPEPCDPPEEAPNEPEPEEAAPLHVERL